MAKKKVEELTIEEKLQNALIPEKDQPYKIPQNWCWVKIMNIGEVVTGSTPNTKEKSYFGGNVPFIKPADIDQGRYIIFSKDTLSEEGKNVSRPVPKGSTCICCIGTIGKCGYLMVDAVTNQQINTIIPYKIVNSLFVYYYCISDYFQCTIINNSYATTIFIIKKSKMSSLPFPLPPLAEQERIANKLDNYISKLDEAKEKLEKVVDTYEFRKSVILHKAFTGQLTKNWRKENKFELDDDIKKKAITKDSMLPDEYLYEIPENWRWVRLGNIGEIVTGSTPNTKDKSYFGGNVPFIKPAELDQEENIISSTETLTEKGKNISRPVRKGSTCICCIGTIGKCGYLRVEAVTNQQINTVIPYDFLDDLFVYYYCCSKFFKKVIRTSKLPFPLPPIEEQKEIVKILDSFLTKEKQVKEIAEKEIERVEELRENLLTRAFGGILGTNNPNEENSIELLKTVL